MRRLFLAIIVASSSLFAPAFADNVVIPSKPAGYHLSANGCFKWKGPNKLYYDVVWVSRESFMDCTGQRESFSDVFYVPSYPYTDVQAFLQDVAQNTIPSPQKMVGSE